MEPLTDNRWLNWQSVKEAWDKSLVQYMSNEEKMSVIGRPVYALFHNGYGTDYAAFYYAECEVIYPQWIIDASISYSQKEYYPMLRKAYEEYRTERDAILKDIMN